MDIEGAEMGTLRGAVESIKNNRPILMLSACHKKNDLINLYNFVNNTVSGYRFYFRCHKPMPIDAVFVCSPGRKVIKCGILKNLMISTL